jgi:hypothetical protein
MRPSFKAALEDIERKGPLEPEELRPFPVAKPPFSIPAADTADLTSGGHSLWELAAEWTPAADSSLRPAAPVVEAPKLSANPDTIAEELNLAQLKSAAEIAQARRRFMWDNHPDRHSDLDRDLANRRVAVANMLLDRALVDLRRRLQW